jgi:predicted permease
VGFLCNRRRLLDAAAIKGVTNLLVLVVTPCVIMHSFVRQSFAPSLLGDLGWALAVSVFAHAAGTALAFLCLRDRNPDREGVLRFAVMFSNAGFMGLPLEYALLGEMGVFYGAVYVVVFNLLCWSYGLVVMCGSLRDVRVRTLFVNPGSVGIALGLPLFLLSFKLPPMIGTPVKMMADVNTPMAMIVIGWYLAEADFRAMLRSGAAYLATVLRLFAIPLAVLGCLYGLTRLFPDLDRVMLVAIVASSSAPAAALTTMLAARYSRDVPMSVGIVTGTTFLSALTMPIVVGLALWLFA